MAKRPLGVSILSVIFVISGVLMLIIQILGSSILGNLSSELGLPSSSMFVSLALIALVNIIAGIGMWQGKEWGWWTGTVSYYFSIIRDFYAIVMVFVLSNQTDTNSIDISSYFFKYFLRILFSIAILSYFYQDHIMEYFNVMKTSKFKAILKAFGASIMLIAFREILILFL